MSLWICYARGVSTCEYGSMSVSSMSVCLLYVRGGWMVSGGGMNAAGGVIEEVGREALMYEANLPLSEMCVCLLACWVHGDVWLQRLPPRFVVCVRVG